MSSRDVTPPDAPGAWHIHADTHPGLVRQRNEDGMAVVPWDGDAWALMVCDGMGGHADGDVASAAAVGALSAHGPEPADPAPYVALHRALVEANAAVATAADGSGAGTTAVVAWLRGPRVWVGWVGDSRLYHVRSGAIVERTTDHTRVAVLVNNGEISEADARSRPDAHVLLQALGVDEVTPSVWAEPLVVEPDDRLVMCSDGLHDLVPDAELAEIVSAFAPEAAVQHLLDLALARGGHDNVTVIVARRLPDATTPTHPTRPTAPDFDPPPTLGPDPDTAPFRPSRPMVLAAIALVFAVGVLVGLTINGVGP